MLKPPGETFQPAKFGVQSAQLYTLGVHVSRRSSALMVVVVVVVVVERGPFLSRSVPASGGRGGGSNR